MRQKIKQRKGVLFHEEKEKMDKNRKSSACRNAIYHLIMISIRLKKAIAVETAREQEMERQMMAQAVLPWEGIRKQSCL